MKTALNHPIVISLCIVLLTFAGCKKSHDAPVPVIDTAIDALSKTWKISSVTRDGVDQTSNYSALTLTFSGAHGNNILNYTVAGRPALSPWPATGTFTFNTNTPQTSMTRNDGTADLPDDVPFTYSVSAGQLQLQFTFVDVGYAARSTEVKGAWVFTFVPN